MFFGMMLILMLNHAITPTICEVVTVYTEEEKNLLYRCVEAEAGNQSDEGKRLVADVILNRVKSEDFPDTIEGVISQKNQFSVWANGSIDRVTPSESTIAAVKEEFKKQLNYDVLFFNAIGYMYGEPWKKVGAHYFSTGGKEK